MTVSAEQTAVEFARALLARDYASAHAMLTPAYQLVLPSDELRASFEDIVPPDWADGTVEHGQTMTEWPGKQPQDMAWVYVVIGGDVYSEAVTVVVSDQAGQPRVRDVEFGRP